MIPLCHDSGGRDIGPDDLPGRPDFPSSMHFRRLSCVISGKGFPWSVFDIREGSGCFHARIARGIPRLSRVQLKRCSSGLTARFDPRQ